MRRIKLTIAIALFTSTSVLGQSNHLEPVEGFFDAFNFQFEYYSQIRKILFEGLSDRPVVRFLVLPSFVQEHVLDIEEDMESKKYFLVYHTVDQMIWSNEEPSKIKVKKFRKEITRESVDMFRTLFLKALKLTRYSNEGKWGLDGVNFYFFAWDSGLLAGTIWSPRKDTELMDLIDISYKLVSLVQGSEKTVKIDGKLKEDIELLTARFK